MALRGKVKFFSGEKGYGFITRDDGRGDVFVHISDAQKGGVADIAQGDVLDFEIQATDKGQRATAIKRA